MATNDGRALPRPEGKRGASKTSPQQAPSTRSGLGISGRSHSLNRENHSNLLINFKTYKVWVIVCSDVGFGLCRVRPLPRKRAITGQSSCRGSQLVKPVDTLIRGSK